MTGRHAAADEVDDQALADQPAAIGAHRADGLPLDPQGIIGDGSVPADADLQVDADPQAQPEPQTQPDPQAQPEPQAQTPPAPRSGRRAARR